MASDTSALVTAKWIKFFRDAGLPPQSAASYAILFAEHRIQANMLADLSRDILQAMGINVMGDIITILKHAKEIHNQANREKALGNEKLSMGPLSVKRSTPASRMLDHYTRKTPDHASSSNSPQRTPKPETVVTLKRKSSEEVPTQKVRRVLPEHEGPYKIKMPAGTTAKTRRLLLQQGLRAVTTAKKSVFDRLGESKVSSTTDNDGPKITVTGIGNSFVRPATKTSKITSVFDRLGPGKSQVSSTSNDDAVDEKNEDPLPYQGILKPTLFKTNVKTTVQKIIKQPQPKPVVKHITYQQPVTKKISVLNRLGPKTSGNSPLNNPVITRSNSLSLDKQIVTYSNLKTAQAVSTTSEGILATGRKLNRTLQARLGNKGPEKITTTNPKFTAIMRKKYSALNTANAGTKMKVLGKFGSSGKVIKKVRVFKRTDVGTKVGVFSRLGTVK